MKKKIIGTVALLSILILGACSKGNMKVPVSGKNAEMIKAALINTEGNEIGQITLAEDEKGVAIHIQAEGLTPGRHGFHVHEKSECTPPSFESAGGHFNPTDKEHGFDNPKGFHLGDLPNIEVDENGQVNKTITTQEITLQKGQENSITDNGGTSIMVHEKADDYVTDPAGNAGDRVACAVVNEP